MIVVYHVTVRRPDHEFRAHNAEPRATFGRETACGTLQKAIAVVLQEAAHADRDQRCAMKVAQRVSATFEEIFRERRGREFWWSSTHAHLDPLPEDVFCWSIKELQVED